MCLPSHFHDETHFEAGVGVGAAESVHHIQAFARQLVHGQLFKFGPRCFGQRFVVVFVFVGGPPYGVLAHFVHHKEFVFGRTSGVNARHHVDGVEFGKTAFVVACKAGFCFLGKQRFVRRIVKHLANAGDAVSAQIYTHNIGSVLIVLPIYFLIKQTKLVFFFRKNK